MRKQRHNLNWELAPDIYEMFSTIVKRLQFYHISLPQIICLRSYGSMARARARIWSFPRVWQLALKLPPYYIVEVISEKFDHLSTDDQKRVLIHELMHIPKNFSGALVPHRGRFTSINRRSVETLFRKYLKPSI